MWARSVMTTTCFTVLSWSPHAFDDRQQVEVDEDHLVLGMVGDIGDVLGRQPRVERVQHRADAGNAEIELEMAIGVPGDGADPVAELDAQPLQRLGQLLGALARVPVAVAVDRPLDRARHDLDVGIVGGGEVDDLRNQQRTVLHQAEHGVSSVTLAARNEGFCDWWAASAWFSTKSRPAGKRPGGVIPPPAGCHPPAGHTSASGIGSCSRCTRSSDISAAGPARRRSAPRRSASRLCCRRRRPARSARRRCG